MALTSPHMSLRIWDQITDLFDHDQLANNFAKLDLHDHTLGRGVQIPTDGIADGAITSPKLAVALDPAPAFTTYKTVLQRGSAHVGGHAAGTQQLLGTTYGSSSNINATNSGAHAIYVDPADYAVAGRSTRFRLRTLLLTNAVAPAATVQVALHPVATWGGAASFGPTIATIGGAVAGSPTVFTNPAAGGGQPPVASSDFALTAGYYTLAYTVNTGTTAATTYLMFQTDLQVRQT